MDKPPSDYAAMRQALAELSAEAEKGRDALRDMAAKLEKRDEIIKGMISEVSRLRAENATLHAVAVAAKLDAKSSGARLAYYENSNVPPAHRNLKQEAEKKKAVKERKAAGPAKKGGRKKGHKGVSRSRKPSRTVYHELDCCGRCGSACLRRVATRSVIVEDIPAIPKVEAVNHVSYQYDCGGCGARCSSDTGNVPGTSIGINLLCIIMEMWFNRAPVRRIARALAAFGARVSAAAVQGAIAAAAHLLAATRQKIFEEMDGAAVIWYDETMYRVRGIPAWLWIAVTPDGVYVMVNYSRGRAALDMMPQCTVVAICDGHRPYVVFLIQRCWSHVLREADGVGDAGEEARALHAKLQRIFAAARDMGLAGPAAALEFQRQVCGVVDGYRKAGLERFAGKLERASPNLFTFMVYEGVEPTNNEAERQIRESVIHRKVRGQLINAAGMERFATLMTCYGTWSKRGVTPTEGLMEAAAQARG